MATASRGVYRLHHEDSESLHIQHPDGSIAQLPRRGTPKHILDAVKYLPRMSDGGQIPRLADGTPDAPVSAANAGVLPDPQLLPPPQPEYREPDESFADQMRDLWSSAKTSAGAVADLATKGPAGMPGPAWGPGAERGATERVLFGQSPDELAAGEAPAAGSAPAPQGAPPLLTRTDASGGVGMQPFPPPPRLPGYPSGGLERGIQSMVQTGREGAQLQAQAQSQQAQDLTKIYQDQQAGLSDIKQRWQAEHQGVATEYANAIDDAKNSRIDPNHFWSSRSTGQKVQTAIGMILSGIGSGLTGQPNTALEVLNRAIDRDIESQKANLGQKNNLVSMLYQKLGNVDHAEAMARMYLTADVAAKVGLAGARSGSLQAQASAKLLESQLQGQALGPMAQIVNGKYQAEIQRYSMAWQQRMMQWQMSQSGGNRAGYIPSSANPPMLSEPSLKGISEQQKDANERRVDLPTFGPNAHTYAKTPTQASEARKSLASMNVLEQQVNHLRDLAKAHGTAIHIPGTAASAAYGATGSGIVTELNKLQDLNRLNENEYSSFGNMIPTAREWLTGAGAAKQQELISRINAKRLSEYTEQLGLDPRLFQPRAFTPAGAQ